MPPDEAEWTAALKELFAEPWRLQPVFQPVIDLARDEVCGYEMLSRFDGRGPRAPVRWFEAAERHGVQGRLEALVLAAAIQARDRLPPNCFLALNLTPSALLEADVQATLSTVGSLDRLVLEVTEHSPIDDPGALSALVSQVRDAGALIAVDDAGAGYGSLQRVMTLAPHFVKLDRELISGIDHDLAKQALVEAVGGFAGRIDAWLVAEGIENEDEQATLQRLGVPLGQGFHLGRPVPFMAARRFSRPRSRTLPPSLARVIETAEPILEHDFDEAVQRFARSPESLFLVVVDDRGRARGLLARQEVDVGVATLRPALTVLPHESLVALGERAITRVRRLRWDPLVCCDERGRYLGIISLEALVLELCRRVRSHEEGQLT